MCTKLGFGCVCPFTRAFSIQHNISKIRRQMFLINYSVNCFFPQQELYLFAGLQFVSIVEGYNMCIQLLYAYKS